MKKLLALLFLLPTLCFAQTPTNWMGNVGQFPGIAPTYFNCSLSALAASLTQCAAASTTGQRYYLTGMAVQTTTATAGTFSIQAGTGANCGSNTTAIFPANATSARWTAPINSQPTSYIFFAPVRSTLPNYALCVIGTATNTINIEVWGYTAP